MQSPQEIAAVIMNGKARIDTAHGRKSIHGITDMIEGCVKSRIEFTENEQNFLAELMSTIWDILDIARSGDHISDDAYAVVGDNIAWAARKFPRVNISNLYDKFHRQGVDR